MSVNRYPRLGNNSRVNLGVLLCTSTTRPVNPRNGQKIYETDTRAEAVWNGTAWVYQSAPIIATSSTRPASPVEGQMIYETDTDLVQVWNGSAWRLMYRDGGWISFTPNLRRADGTVPHTATVASWTRIGRTIFFQSAIAITGAGTGTNFFLIDLPVASPFGGYVLCHGHFAHINGSGVVTLAQLLCNGGQAAGFPNASSGFLAAATGSGHSVNVCGTYEALT